MSHVLVRWLNTGKARMWDVVAVRDIVDTRVGATILQNSKDSSVLNTNVHVRWEGEKHPAMIVAVGKFAPITL